MSKSKVIPVNKLKRGMIFSEIPAAWHGPGVVIESHSSGDCWKIKFDNNKVINPPGIIYTDPTERVRVYPKSRRNHGRA
jgi:hypothetical protein